MLYEQCRAEPAGRTIDRSSSVTLKIFADPLARAGLEEILKATRFVVLAGGPGSSDAPCDLFILDERHGPDGLAGRIVALKTQHPAARVVVLTDQIDLDTAVATLQAGANGLWLTTINCDVLIHSLELVMLGEVVVPTPLILATLAEGKRKVDTSLQREPEHVNNISPPRRPLSSREFEILCWLKEGAPNKVIARELNMAEATVKVHVKAILRKIGAGNRTQAAIWASDNLRVEAQGR